MRFAAVRLSLYEFRRDRREAVFLFVRPQRLGQVNAAGRPYAAPNVGYWGNNGQKAAFGQCGLSANDPNRRFLTRIAFAAGTPPGLIQRGAAS
jgi:hypothetical protein